MGNKISRKKIGNNNADKETNSKSSPELNPFKYKKSIDKNSDVIIFEKNNIETKRKRDFIPKTRKHLIIDDAKYNREILSKYLTKVNINSDEAANGKQALEYLDKINEYDIVWMDLRMPIMNGFDCTIELRKNGYQGIIIGITGDVSQENVLACYTVGMDHVIFKPVVYSDLVQMYYIKKYTSGT